MSFTSAASRILALVALFTLSLVYQAFAICAGGFDFGIGQKISGQPGAPNDTRWNVYDIGCHVIDGLTTHENPCDQGIFGCSPELLFARYINTDTNLRYACREDPLSENCGGNPISVCCRNDGG
ncbi:hypothetical protein K435DRAFT_677584 [Dendrothele bispora CBS 962.96]|uniref:Hydrophobin n=1 Tax=Dendrothele bispora (strain CBS 962.96) TaxID=1314807 RepID=A0A4V4HE22_DENBC|nr:hypothetical protein K435DRAFT_677584 [Dendrothele bispora CBS 962.96]